MLWIPGKCYGNVKHKINKKKNISMDESFVIFIHFIHWGDDGATEIHFGPSFSLLLISVRLINEINGQPYTCLVPQTHNKRVNFCWQNHRSKKCMNFFNQNNKTASTTNVSALIYCDLNDNRLNRWIFINHFESIFTWNDFIWLNQLS